MYFTTCKFYLNLRGVGISQKLLPKFSDKFQTPYLGEKDLLLVPCLLLQFLLFLCFATLHLECLCPIYIELFSTALKFSINMSFWRNFPSLPLLSHVLLFAILQNFKPSQHCPILLLIHISLCFPQTPSRAGPCRV